jgi:transposase
VRKHGTRFFACLETRGFFITSLRGGDVLTDCQSKRLRAWKKLLPQIKQRVCFIVIPRFRPNTCKKNPLHNSPTLTYVKHYIGIDISKNWLDVSVLSPPMVQAAEIKCDNSLTGLKKLKSTLKRRGIILNKSTLVTCEHTGLYKKTLVDFLVREKSLLCIEVAQRIKKSLGIQRGKTDRIDARRIAEYSLRHFESLMMWKNPRKVILRLRDLISNRERIIKTINMLQVPLDNLRCFYSASEHSFFDKLNTNALLGLRSSLVEIDAEISKITKDKKISMQLKLLLSVPGVGLVTGLSLICCTYEFTICNTANQLACYAGIAPFEHTSGSSVRGKSRVSHIANKKLKALLHLGALSQIKTAGAFSEYYKRKVGEGKNKMLVINAVRNKIIHRVAAVINRGTPYL